MIEAGVRVSIQSVIDQFVREELSAENAHIATAVWSMLDAGGKRLRPRITMLAARACDANAPDDPVLASYMELIHVATLIHDDVLDNADVRRGVASTNRAFGNRFSVLAGDYLFAWVFKKVTQTYPAPVPTVLAAMLAEICNGEVRQLRAAGNPDLPMSDYLTIIGKKTAELFAACAECGAIVALAGRRGAAPSRNADEVKALRAYGWSFGMAFQMRDDLLDVTASEDALGKPAGSDLREKKMTMPLIFALARGGAAVRAEVDALFACDDASPASTAERAAVVADMIRTGPAVALTRRAIADHASAAEAALNALEPSEARDDLAALARGLTEVSP